MKRKLFISVCLGAALLLGACAGSEKEVMDPEQISFTNSFTATKEGIYQISNNNASGNRMVMYYDAKTKLTMPLCDRANCNHKDTDCPAIQLGTYKKRNLLTVWNYQNKLYLVYIDFEGQGNLGGVIMQADMDGKNREHVYTLPKEIILNTAMMYQNKLFISANTFGEIDETTFGTNGTTLFVLDMKAKKLKEVVKTEKDENGFLFFIGSKKGKAYYIHDNYDKAQKPIYVYDIKTGKSKLFNDENTVVTSMLHKDELFYADTTTNQLIAYDIFTKEKRVLDSYTPHEGTLYQMSNEGILSLRFVTNSELPSAKAYTQVYDVEKKQFLFEDYQDDIYVNGHYKDGYIGSKQSIEGIYNNAMTFTAFHE